VTSRVAHLAGRSVRYLDAGGDTGRDGRPAGPDRRGPERKTLILIHAFPLSADQWLPQLHRAPPGWRVVAPDLRGFRPDAATPAEPVPAGFTMDDYAADVVAMMDHLDIRRAVIGGVSMGGYVAFGLMRIAPARAAALVLAHTRASADTAEGRANRDRTIDLVRREGPGSVAASMAPKLLGETTRREQPDLEEVVDRMIRANTADAIAGALGALRDRPDSTLLLPGIACPTVVVAGGEDAIVPRAEAEAMHRAIAGSRLVVLPHVGHLGNLEDPRGFNAALYSTLPA